MQFHAVPCRGTASWQMSKTTSYLMCARCFADEEHESKMPATKPVKPIETTLCQECGREFSEETSSIVACCCGDLILCWRCAEEGKSPIHVGKLSQKWGLCHNQDCRRLVCEDNCMPGICETEGCDNLICEGCREDDPFEVCACDSDYFCSTCVRRMKKCDCGRPLCSKDCKDLCDRC